jgi:transcriptional regulator with XRE-family HTH domain
VVTAKQTGPRRSKCQLHRLYTKSNVNYRDIRCPRIVSAELTLRQRSVSLGSVTTAFLGDFGRAVRHFRQERGLTQAELADRLGLGRTSVTNLEKGAQNPPLSLLPELASALGIDLLRLVATAIGVSAERDLQTLTARVPDDELRRWAGQVIGDTLAGQTTGDLAHDSKRRRSP